ncbi:MAG: penicillin-binding protein activator LpoB [candidate division Zixibacteria bacterium HGW-Zixibacteria-1]|nr:MAG: penicillin-binding protein activator LpoB [candidate division Zixibacteria bacterium HGW-Zixibacteria-1]
MLMGLLVAGCGGSSTQVTRIDPETQTDLSGNWNDTDARLVAQEMITDAVARVWITDFAAATGNKPVVTVGTIRNMSSEHIDTETFTADFERELINSGKVRFVASSGQRDEIRGERFDQQDFASKETMKKIRNETGADFILMGAIKTIVDQVEGIKVVYYQTDLEMINIESMEKVWIGTKKIKKEISQGKTKW